MQYSQPIILLVLFLIGFGLQAQIVLNHTTTDILCNGASNASITFSLSGGSPPYEYGWKRINNNFIFIQGTLEDNNHQETIGGNFYATSYIIEATDSNGTILIDTVVISEPPPLLSTSTIENPSCFSTCDGNIALSAEGGFGDITISWSDVDALTPLRTALCAGSYFYFLVDENNCTQKGIIDLFEPAPIALTANLETPSCLGQNNGSIQVTSLTGGTTPYTYTWENNSHDSLLTELEAGFHQLIIQDSNQCVLDSTFFIEMGKEVLPNVLLNYGCGDGQVIASSNPIHAQEPFEINWSTGSDQALLHSLSAGFYAVSVTDALGCVGVEDFTVDFVPPLTVSSQITAVSCPQAEDGSILINISGGIEPYSFSWSNNTSNQHLENVGGGEYHFNLSANGCGINESFFIPEAPPIEVDFIFEAYLNDMISATALVSGGHPPYSLAWSNGETAPTNHQLSPSSLYQLTITDSNHCTLTETFDATLTDSQSIYDKSISLYPIPAKDKIWVNWPSIAYSKEGLTIEIFNSNGVKMPTKAIWQGNTIEVDIEMLNSGAYFLLFSSKNHRFHTQFIVI